MSDIIESNPDILGGKPIIKGTRIPVALIYELIGLNYSIDEILKEYPHLDRKIILTLLKIGKDANENLMNMDIEKIINKGILSLKILLDENLLTSIEANNFH